MKPNQIAALEAFEQAAITLASTRVSVRRGRPTAEDIRHHAARTAAQFYLTTVWKRTARAGLPDGTPEEPTKVRHIYRDASNHGKNSDDSR